MSESETVSNACAAFRNDRGRLLDILWQIQDSLGAINRDSMTLIAEKLAIPVVEVEGVVTFYAFFSEQKLGRVVIRLCEDIIDQHQGMAEIEDAFSQCLGIAPGGTTEDGLFTLLRTPCIGLSDQAPAALINFVPFTHLKPGSVKLLVQTLRKNPDPQALITHYGDGQNAHPLIRSGVHNLIRKRGHMLLGQVPEEAGWQIAAQLSPTDIVQRISASELRGRGGAGFRTGLKWRMAARSPALDRVVICNADEGEPGTCKDRVLLTERPQLLIEGMRIAARAIQAKQGIIYLRAEYRYLQPYLESLLQDARMQGQLGRQAGFDIRIQLGAGAYICGEESSLIRSCEGYRGEPGNRPPYPVQSGYQGLPTVVNNVETLCLVPRILAEGEQWFRQTGTAQSPGAKLYSISGDCSKPGIYELPLGTPLRDLLEMAGGQDAAAVQVGGASGEIVAPVNFDRPLSFEALNSAGSIMVFSGERNLLEVVDYFLHFFVEESCGYCTPCRVGNVFLKQGLEKIRHGLAESTDLENLRQLSQTIIATSRCGLGHTSPKPFLTSLQQFPLVYGALLQHSKSGQQAGFDIQQAVSEARHIARRRSQIYDPDYSQSEGS